MGRFLRLFLLLLLLPLAVAAGQNTLPPEPVRPQPAGPAKVLSVPAPGGTDRQITLDVQVTDRSGARLRGLQKEDFTLLDDKQPRNILSFHAVNSGGTSTAGTSTPDTPVEIVLVVDAVNASFRSVAFERDAVKKFLLRNGGKLAQPVSLIFFSDAGTKTENGSSRDGNALAALYDRYETGLRSIKRSQGFYGATERFSLSLKTLTSLASYEGTRPGRKLMIWISPGWPLLSGPNVELSDRDRQQIFNSIVVASTMVRQAHITLYSVDPGGSADAGGVRTGYYKEFLKGVKSPSRALSADLGLQVLAVQSGGLVFNATNDLTGAIANCVADSDTFYVLSFNAPPADGPNEYHALKVTVDKPGYLARTHTGYYAQP
jgi:VWFA-related protein